MNKKLLKEINHFRKLTNLPLIVEEGGRGEATVFKELLNTIFKNEVKYAAEGMFTYLNREGRKVVLKPEVAKNILERDVTTITRFEEIEAYQALHDNIVNKFGAKTVASVINFELKKIANPITREATKRFILEKSFNKSKSLMKSEMENLENVVQNQAQDVKPTNLPKIDVPISNSELKGLSGKDAQAVRNFVDDIENSTTTMEGRIRLYNLLDDARFKSAKRNIDNELQRMEADSRQRLQPHVEDANVAEEVARKAKAEADAQIHKNRRKISNMDVWNKRFMTTGSAMNVIMLVLKFLLFLFVCYLLWKGAMWAYKTVSAWFNGGSTSGGSLPSSTHNPWSEPGGSKPNKNNNNNDEGSLDNPDNLPDN